MFIELTQKLLFGRSKLSKMDIELANEDEERKHATTPEERPSSAPPSPIVMFAINTNFTSLIF